jgi:CubicO group peptidase (beta-lactamase class C family)
MKNSTITEGPHPESGVAHAYRMVNGNYVEYDYGEFPTFAAAGNGGIWSSVSELVLYEKALQNEVFINAETLTKSRTAYTSSDWEPSTTPFVGHSWFLDKDQLFPTIDIPFDIVYHTGSQGGFRAYYIYIPEKEILFLSTFNRPVNQSILNAVCELLSAYDWLD